MWRPGARSAVLRGSGRDPDHRRAGPRSPAGRPVRQRHEAHRRPGPGGAVLQPRVADRRLAGPAHARPLRRLGRRRARGALPGRRGRGHGRRHRQGGRGDPAQHHELGLRGAEVSAEPAQRFVTTTPVLPYDIVFADPPYAMPARRPARRAGRRRQPRPARRRCGGRGRAVQPGHAVAVAARASSRVANVATVRRHSGTATRRRAECPSEPARHRRSRAPRHLPRVVRPGDQRPSRHHQPGQRALRRADHRRAGQPCEAEHVRPRRADGPAARGDARATTTS